MKKTLTLLVLFVTVSISAQLDSEKLLSIYRNDDVIALQKILTNENKDKCIKIKEFEYTFLTLAIKFDRKKIFEMLLKNNVDVEKYCGSKSPLMYAAKYGNLSFAKKLVKAGAKVNARNYRGRTALDYAKKYKQKEIFKYLDSQLL